AGSVRTTAPGPVCCGSVEPRQLLCPPGRGGAPNGCPRQRGGRTKIAASGTGIGERDGQANRVAVVPRQVAPRRQRFPRRLSGQAAREEGDVEVVIQGKIPIGLVAEDAGLTADKQVVEHRTAAVTRQADRQLTV